MIFLLDFLFVHNWIFKIYLTLIFFLNIYICVKFALPILNKNNLTNIMHNEDNNYSEYLMMFKKLIKITNNPIIFEYQLEQSKKIDEECEKYIKYKKVISNMTNDTINNYNNYNNLKKYYMKIQKILSRYNKNDDTLIKLLYINF